MHKERALTRELRNPLQLIAFVDRPEFRCLRHADHARLRRMNIRKPSQRERDLSEIEFSVCTGSRDELRASGKEFGCAAFIGLDVRALMTKDSIEWSAKLRESQRIGGGAIKDKESFTIGFEQFTDQLTRAFRPTIFAVRRRGVAIRFNKRFPDRGRNRRGFVARKVVTLHPLLVTR